jgi:hypothetical protein
MRWLCVRRSNQNSQSLGSFGIIGYSAYITNGVGGYARPYGIVSTKKGQGEILRNLNVWEIRFVRKFDIRIGPTLDKLNPSEWYLNWYLFIPT